MATSSNTDLLVRSDNLAQVTASSQPQLGAAASLPVADFLGPERPHHAPSLEDRVDLDLQDERLRKANEVVEKVKASLGGRRGVLQKVLFNEKRNGPSVISKSDVEARKACFEPVMQGIREKKGLSAEDKIEKKLGFEDLEHFNEHLTSAGLSRPSLVANAADVSAENFCEIYFKDVKDGDSIRIVEPGNNDQSTPIVLANTIAHMKAYFASKGIHNISVEVLVLGKGGHATTELFDQIGIFNQSKEFVGVAEADSLGGTLESALREKGIMPSISDVSTKFSSEGVGFRVQIKKEAASTNTGQNVEAAAKAWADSTERTNYVVAAATTANCRQVQTFAQQFTKPYDRMIGMPMDRSQHFIERAFDDKALVTECLAGLAERARSFAYMLQGTTGFIPLNAVDQEDLRSLYETYAQMKQTSFEEASKDSIGAVQEFFAAEFAVMERAIQENITKDESHFAKTTEKVQQIVRKFQLTEVVENWFARFVACLSPGSPPVFA